MYVLTRDKELCKATGIYNTGAQDSQLILIGSLILVQS